MKRRDSFLSTNRRLQNMQKDVVSRQHYISSYFPLKALFLLLVVLILSPQNASGWYLPGVAPHDYREKEEVKLKVNTLTSVKTQLPYSFYYLPFCRPDDIHRDVENLGEVLTGDVIQNSMYQIKMLQPETCKVLCTKEMKDEDRKRFKFAIENDYVVNWIVDNLPVATGYAAENEDVLLPGFPVGQQKEGGGKGGDSIELNNHVSITLQYHERQVGEEKLWRIVGFIVQPKSIAHETSADGTLKCSGGSLELSKAGTVIFTYDVSWQPSDVKWASRWDVYLKRAHGQVHSFSVINSLMVVLFLSGMVAMILFRTLLRDIARYNEMVDSLEEAQEESGWKLVHGDVFRRPPYYQLLAVCTGTGVQVVGMTLVVLVFAAVGLLSPAHRGGLLQAVLVLFTFMGFPAGYTAARMNNVMEGDDCQRSVAVTLYTAFGFPGACFIVFFILEMMIWGQASSGAVPFTTMIFLLLLWFGISVPLVFMGAYFGYKKGPIKLPVSTNQIPRQIPPQHWLTHPVVTCVVGGVLPFGAVFTELFFIINSMWQHQFYYLFGFLFIVLIILCVTCGEISIAFTYFQLAGEDYRWWWRCFLCSGASAVYVFLYSILYFCTRLEIDKFISALMYFSYMLLGSIGFFLMTGALGFLSTFWFVRAIYGSIKVD